MEEHVLWGRRVLELVAGGGGMEKG
jgi:hypothetical protein